jgi:hypothetical protein
LRQNGDAAEADDAVLHYKYALGKRGRQCAASLYLAISQVQAPTRRTAKKIVRLHSKELDSRHIDRLNLERIAITIFVNANEKNEIACAFPDSMKIDQNVPVAPHPPVHGRSPSFFGEADQLVPIGCDISSYPCCFPR